MPDGSRSWSNRRVGRLGEDLAALFASLAGMRVLARNLQVGHKEIDLLLLDGDCLVFAEVRLRRSDRCGRAAESVTRLKSRRLRQALLEEIRRRRWRGAYRMDLVSIDLSADRSRLVLEHWRGI